MARRSVLVYDLLRTEQPLDGFSPKEILKRIASKYDIAVSKTLERDVAVALRCGLDFCILAKKRNKFRFEPSFHQAAKNSRRSRNVRRGTRTRKRKRRRSSSRKARGGSTASRGRRGQRPRSTRNRGKARKPRSSPVPRPRLPPPPSWSPKRRYLAEEPIPKVIKHS